MSSRSVIVIGGGLAGLSSAVALAEAGFHVRLLEMRPHLGGRATSYFLPDGSHVDNCQHVTMRCCTNLSDFYRRVGAEAKIRYYDTLYFSDADGKRGRIKPSVLPAPLHLSPSFIAFPLLSWTDKRAIASAMLQILRWDAASIASDLSMLDWLQQQRQTPAAIERFWRVVLVSALNEELERCSARHAAEVFWKGFLSHARGFEMGIPCVPLAQLYDGCRTAITACGGQVSLRAGVQQIQVAEGRVQGVVLDDGETLSAEFIVCTVPQKALLELLPEAVIRGEKTFAQLCNLSDSPITGVHLWFDRPVMTEPFLTVMERTTQWIFNKSMLYAETDETAQATGEQYLQLVISASYGLVERSRQEIIDLCLAEIRQALPATSNAQLTKATVIKEAHATFSPAPGCDRFRPSTASPIRGLFLAGDWTATGWPATMEGAVRSGYLAAEAILAEVGIAKKILCPDLPVQGLAGMFGRR